MTTSATRFLCWMAGCALFSATLASGQDTPAREAERLFHAGTSMVLADENDQARDLFHRSLETFPTPEAAFNLATMERRLGRPTQAIRVLEELLEGRFGNVSSEQREEVAALLTSSREDLAQVMVTVTGVTDPSVTLDEGRPFSAQANGQFVTEVDPGAHTVVVSAGESRAVRRFVVAAGASVHLEMEVAALELPSSVPPSAVPPSAVPPSAVVQPSAALQRVPEQEGVERETQSTVFESPFFWLASTAVLGGITLGVVLATSSEEEPFLGSHSALR